MIEVITAGIILGITLAFMVGPVFFLLIETSLTKGIKKAIVFDLGVLAADIIFILLIVVGSQFIDFINNAIWIYAIGGILIIAFGLYNISSAKKKKVQLANNDEMDSSTASNYVYLAKGFFLNILNVGVFAYWLTTTLTLRASLQDRGDIDMLMTAYFIATVAAYFGTDLVKIVTAQRIKQKLTPEVLVRIEKIVGFILLIFGAVLIVRGLLVSKGIGM